MILEEEHLHRHRHTLYRDNCVTRLYKREWCRGQTLLIMCIPTLSSPFDSDIHHTYCDPDNTITSEGF